MEDYVFISYSSKNNVKAKNFRNILEANGIKCWRAPESIETGDNYAKAIPSAIKNCGVMVVLISKCSQQSQWVPKEVDLAIKQQKPILPVYIENCDLVEPFDLYLSNVQAEKMFAQRREAIKNIVQRIRAFIPIFIPEAEEPNAKKSKKNNEPDPRRDKCPIKIAAVGVGGGGIGIANKLKKKSADIYKYVAIDCDGETLSRSNADVKLHIDVDSVEDVSGNPPNAEIAVRGCADKIKDAIADSDWVFVISAFGGGTGTGGASVVASIARELGKLTVAYVTTPFVFESIERYNNAQYGMSKIYDGADSVVRVDQATLPKSVADSVSFESAISYTDGIVLKSIMSLTDVVCMNGQINIDAEDLRSLLNDGGETVIGIGEASGINRDIDAANQALSNLPFGTENGRAERAIVNIIGSDNISLDEAQRVAALIRNACDENASIILGMGMMPELGESMRVTVIASMGKDRNVSAFCDDLSPKKYAFPPIDLLKAYDCSPFDPEKEKATAEKLASVVKQFIKSDVKVSDIVHGGFFTRYELNVSDGSKIKHIEKIGPNLEYELALADRLRIIAPIPGKRAVGIEIPNKTRDVVGLRDVMEKAVAVNNDRKFAFAVGTDVYGKAVLCDLEKTPHLLVAGRTGSGKSIFVHGLIISLLYKCAPDELRFLLVDFKQTEFNKYKDIPHLLPCGVVHDGKKTVSLLESAVSEMERRYMILSNARCMNIAAYNGSKAVTSGAAEKLPRIVIIIDEFADLMASECRKAAEECIMRLAQKSRAAGIHLIIATQRPSCDVITGSIKANITSRIAFTVSSMIDSRVILDMAGAETLSGRGDMLYFPCDRSAPQRVQGALVTSEEIDAVVKYISENYRA